MDKDLVFIVSGGRTGTTFFGRRLQRMIHDSFSVHEPDLWAGFNRRSLRALKTFGVRHMIIDRLRQRSGIRNLAQKHLAGTWSRGQLRRAVEAHRRHYYESIPEPLIVEAYYQWYGLLPIIREAFPDAKIVGVVRDPREWVPSWMNFGGHHDGRDLVTRLGQSRLTPEMVGDVEYAFRWDSMDQFERLCWDWRIVTRIISDFARTDSLTRIYRFEDLFKGENRVEIARDLLEFATTHPLRDYPFVLSEEDLRSRVNASDSARFPRWTEWDSGKVDFMKQCCGPQMEELGYGHETGW